LRFPEKLLVRIDKCAKATGNSRTDTVLHLIRWALEEYEKERGAEIRAGAKQ
jgi:metal-responsive CopG/Arc/MetJ family transcriptional regulator